MQLSNSLLLLLCFHTTIHAQQHYRMERIITPVEVVSRAGINDRGDIFIWGKWVGGGWVKPNASEWIQVYVESQSVLIEEISNTGMLTGSYSSSPRGAYLWELGAQEGKFLNGTDSLYQRGVSDNGDVLAIVGHGSGEYFVYRDGELLDFNKIDYPFDTANLRPEFMSTSGAIHGVIQKAFNEYNPFVVNEDTLSVNESITLTQSESEEIEHASASGHVIVITTGGRTLIYGGGIEGALNADNFAGNHINENGVSVGRGYNAENNLNFAAGWNAIDGVVDLNSVVVNPIGNPRLSEAFQINAHSEIIAGSDNGLYLLRPTDQTTIDAKALETKTFQQEALLSMTVTFSRTPIVSTLESSTDLKSWATIPDALPVSIEENRFTYRISESNNHFFRIVGTFD
ncbi:MAG: hypothetical protein ACI92G_002042 [Candidatus Pelagisphaera sp.]|jgi:hypothetical protein